jgi:hypothetical protein
MRQEKVVRITGTVIVLIISSLLIWNFVSVYFLHFSTGTCDGIPVASLVPSPFDNPRPNVTINGGGWVVNVTAISNTEYWSMITVDLAQYSVPFTRMERVNSANADILVQKSSNTEIGNWYLKKSDAVSVDQVEFSDGKQPSAISLNGARSDLYGDRPLTVQMARFIVVDADSSGTITAGDYILVYTDSNADGVKDVPENSSTLTISTQGTTIAVAELLPSMAPQDFNGH